MQIKTKIFSCHTADSKPVKREVKGAVILPPLVFPGLGNCDICAEQKISIMNDPKQYKIWSKQNILVIKNFCNLPPNLAKGLNKSWLKFHPFCIWTKFNHQVFVPGKPFQQSLMLWVRLDPYRCVLEEK